MDKLILKPSREKSLLRRHPWVFSGAVDRVEGQPSTGATVELRGSGGAFLAWAAYSPASQIMARVWSFSETVRVDRAFFRARLQRAIEMRQALLGPTASTAARLVHAESDGLPGVVVDRYADTVVMQLTSAGAYHWRDTLVDLLAELTGAAAVFERYGAINELMGVPNQLIEYAVNSVTEGIDAQGEVTVRVDVDGRTFVGRSADTDIVVASAKALMNALNRAIAHMPGHAQREVLSNP